MRSNKELETTTIDELVNYLITSLRQAKIGSINSTEGLMSEYYQGNNFHKINPREVHNRLWQKAREEYILLDVSELYGEKQLFPQKSQFKIWRKKNYISDDKFRELCDDYDSLYNDLEINDPEFDKIKKRILANWKNECNIFKKNPQATLKPKRIVRVKDLDRTPFDAPVSEDLPNKGICVIPIGSGSDGNSMYFEIGDHKILVDAGIAKRKVELALQKNNRSINDIEAIFITHGHSDHINSIKAIAKAADCPIYTSEWTKKDLTALGIDSIAIEPMEEAELLPGLKTIMFEADHDYLFTYGFVFVSSNTKISYLTDNGSISNIQLKLMYGSDLVVLEANHDLDKLEYNVSGELTWRVSVNHSSNIRCGYGMIELHKKGTRNFILAHVSKKNNSPALIMDTITTMLRSYFANIYICKEESDELLYY